MKLIRRPLILGTELSEVSLEQAGDETVNLYAGGMVPASSGDGDGGGDGSGAGAIVKLLFGPPFIITNPGDQSIVQGANAVFSVTAGGSGPLSYQWQISALSPVAWSNIPGATAATVTLEDPPISEDASQVRCIVSNAYGSTSSLSGRLFISAPTSGAPYIIEDPENQGALPPTGNALFTVTAGGAPVLLYQWQLSTDGGSTWSNLSDGSPYAGTATAALTVSPCIVGYNGHLFRCVVSNGSGSVDSNSASLTVSDPVITVQPTGQTGNVGDLLAFEVTALGATTLSYAWETSTDGGATWTSTGVTTFFQTFTISALSDTGRLFRCVVTDTAGSVTSSAAGVTVTQADPGFSVTIDRQYLMANGAYPSASIDSPAITPTYTGSFPPFTFTGTSNPQVSANCAVNFLRTGNPFAFRLATFDPSGFGRFASGPESTFDFSLNFCDSQGNTFSIYIPVFMQIQPNYSTYYAGSGPLSDCTLNGSGSTAATTNLANLGVTLAGSIAGGYTLQIDESNYSTADTLDLLTVPTFPATQNPPAAFTVQGQISGITSPLTIYALIAAQVEGTVGAQTVIGYSNVCLVTIDLSG